MTQLSADDIVDLGRWHFIQFKDEATAEAAMEKYRRFVERQRDAAGDLSDAEIERIEDLEGDDQERRAA